MFDKPYTLIYICCSYFEKKHHRSFDTYDNKDHTCDISSHNVMCIFIEIAIM